ncbi:MAG: hypothetical protein M2R45_02136 [Verrucomicrobia subdivision 3 bacterium]|nr:hypothetical protein [Limisphaerales bacterium]MCS1413713.1 hypothetical protein [Limisphaerales bacterium]
MSRTRSRRHHARQGSLVVAVGLVLLWGCVTPVPEPRPVTTVTLPQYVQPFNGVDLGGWRRPVGNWMVVESAEADAFDQTKLLLTEGTGVLVNGTEGKTSNLLTVMEHGDAEIHLEFLVPRNSNSGVYLQGRYELQILDSWGNYEPTFGDCGGIYERWANGKGFEGRRPRVNASLPSGNWQRFDITFRAPRFDVTGRKIENARFIKVVHNGVTIHENVEVTGPTRSAPFDDEQPWGPLMLQGDHGPVAYQNMLIRHLYLP